MQSQTINFLQAMGHLSGSNVDLKKMISKIHEFLKNNGTGRILGTIENTDSIVDTLRDYLMVRI